MIGTPEQTSITAIDQEEILIREGKAVTIRCYDKIHSDVFIIFDKNAVEARAEYNKYVGSLPVEGAEAADLSEQLAANFTRISGGLSASRIVELVRQKHEELQSQQSVYSQTLLIKG